MDRMDWHRIGDGLVVNRYLADQTRISLSDWIASLTGDRRIGSELALDWKSSRVLASDWGSFRGWRCPIRPPSRHFGRSP